MVEIMMMVKMMVEIKLIVLFNVLGLIIFILMTIQICDSILKTGLLCRIRISFVPLFGKACTHVISFSYYTFFIIRSSAPLCQECLSLSPVR